MQFRPSYIYCKYAIKRLHRFQDLIRHDRRWAGDIDFAEPLEKLLPKDSPKNKAHAIIDQQINRLMPSIQEILYKANIDTAIVQSYHKYDSEIEQMVRDKNRTENYDLLTHYFHIGGSHDVYELLMRVIEQGIGFYEDRQGSALLDLINPVAWIAWFIRLPFVILGWAGMEDKNVVVRLYEWFIRIMIGLLIAFGVTKLGISIPWSELIKLIRG